MRQRPICLALVLALSLLPMLSGVATAQPASPTVAPPVMPTASIANDSAQEDFPAVCVDSEGAPWVVYVEYDGEADTVMIARLVDGKLQPLGPLSAAGIMSRPTIACAGDGTIWAFWSDYNDDTDVWTLKTRAVVNGQIHANVITLEGDSGSALYADAGTDAQGRVWCAWQSFRAGLGDIFARCYDPIAGVLSDEIQVTSDPGGDWEPRLAFSPTDDAAWIAFDSSREDDEFNVYLARVTAEGQVKTTQVSSSPRYEGRPSIAATPDGKGFWIAWENGRVLWGKNTRGVGAAIGLNGDKRIDMVHFNLADGAVTPAADPTPVLRSSLKGKKPKPPAKGQGAPVSALNLPEVVVDAAGNPWMAVRYFVATHWRIALLKYDVASGSWTAPARVGSSSFSQDRRCNSARSADGDLWLTWPSDLRVNKKPETCGVYLTKIDVSAELPPASPVPNAQAANETLPAPRWGDDTPDRARADHHVWKVNGEEFGLYWGDFHRHTDISNCRTGTEGCIAEQFRYAYDVSKLDLLGTSDHTDIGKAYSPYEWWCSQRLADMFHVPGFFTGMYVYEREQKWPWGHRNVIFSERGGPIIYINRELYQSMPWDATLPVGEGGPEILPPEVWSLLRANGMDVSVISHTGATGMGTDWTGYEEIDNAVENVVEIYQGARVSYEAVGAPQPTVGFPLGEELEQDAHGSYQPPSQDFGQFNNGTYQTALRKGWKLGVFANSDHISTSTSFGGVYARSGSREDILEGLNARRTIAGTDKIFIEFSCNGHLLGEEIETSEKPTMTVSVHALAPIRAVTILRNEANVRRFTPEDTNDLEVTFTDEQPLDGENRYYVRVEQSDGSIGWASPIWVTYSP